MAQPQAWNSGKLAEVARAWQAKHSSACVCAHLTANVVLCAVALTEHKESWNELVLARGGNAGGARLSKALFAPKRARISFSSHYLTFYVCVL